MSRLIDADALKQYIDNAEFCTNCPDSKPRCSYDCSMPECLTGRWERVIDEQPTVHPEPESENELPRRTRWCHHCEFGYVDVNDYPCSDCDAMNVPIHFKPKEGAEQE